jgi:two-component system, NtrC family, response regulator HydG
MQTILIIDDDVEGCFLLSRYLGKNNYKVETSHSGSKGIAKALEQSFDLVLSDFRLGDMDGREVLQKIKKIKPNQPVIMITSYTDIKTAVDLIKMGAFDYLTKPLIPEEVVITIRKALSHEKPAAARHEVAESPIKKTAKKQNEDIIVRLDDQDFLKTKSPESNELYTQLELIAATNYNVILYGESGTGKEVMAKSIHNHSNRSTQQFIALDCGTLTKELAGSELFGHEKGAFTGAVTTKTGHFELADKGTLFLDEVGNLPYDVQAVLLRVIQERKIKRIGGTKEIDVDVRLIVAAHESLQDAYKNGKFREDLYHRFNEFTINIPPLRVRKADIMNFAQFFLDKTNLELDKNIEGFDEEVKEIFLNYQWSGNLREMRNIIRRTVLLTDEGMVLAKSLPHEMSHQSNPAQKPVFYHSSKDSSKDLAHETEYEKINSVLKQVNYSKTKAAEILNIDRKTLYNKMKEYNLLKE